MSAENPTGNDSEIPDVLEDPFLGLARNPELLDILRQKFALQLTQVEEASLGLSNPTPLDATVYALQHVETALLHHAALGCLEQLAGNNGEAAQIGELIQRIWRIFRTTTTTGDNSSLRNYMTGASMSLKEESERERTKPGERKKRRMARRFETLAEVIPLQGDPSLLPQNLAYFHDGVIRPEGHDYEAEFLSPPPLSREELDEQQKVIIKRFRQFVPQVVNCEASSLETAIDLSLEIAIGDQIQSETLARVAHYDEDTDLLNYYVRRSMSIDFTLRSALQGQYLPLKYFLTNWTIPELEEVVANHKGDPAYHQLSLFVEKQREFADLMPEGKGEPVNLDKIRKIKSQYSEEK